MQSPSKPGLDDIEAIAKVIKRENADMVMQQEINVSTGHSGNVNPAEHSLLNPVMLSSYLQRRLTMIAGNTALPFYQKYPLSRTTINLLPTDEGTGGERRTLAMATITFAGGKSLVVGCTYLDARDNSINRLLK